MHDYVFVFYGYLTNHYKLSGLKEHPFSRRFTVLPIRCLTRYSGHYKTDINVLGEFLPESSEKILLPGSFLLLAEFNSLEM